MTTPTPPLTPREQISALAESVERLTRALEARDVISPGAVARTLLPLQRATSPSPRPGADLSRVSDKVLSEELKRLSEEICHQPSDEHAQRITVLAQEIARRGAPVS